MSFDLDKSSNKLLILLLSADFIFIVVHILYMNEFMSNSLYSIDRDLGYAEVYQYIKEFWIVLLLLFVATGRKQVAYLAWATLFMYFLLDDSLRVHERFGGSLAYNFNFQPMLNLRAQDIGELIASLFFGVLLLVFVWVAYLYSDEYAKKHSRHLFVLVMLVAFFGILVDMFHVALPWGKSLLGLIEDGGEMLMMSVIVWYVFKIEYASNINVRGNR